MAFVALGCGGRSAAGSPEHQRDPPVVTGDDFARVTAESACARLAPCCAGEGLGFEQARCESALAEAFAVPLELVAQGRALLDAGAAAQCILDMEESLERCTMSRTLACRTALRGTLEVGAQCSSSYECRSEGDGAGWCDSENERCARSPRGRLNDTCGRTCIEDDLRFALGDWPGGGPLRCEAVVGLEQNRCFLNDGLHCEKSSGRCQPLGGPGDACELVSCEPSLFCDAGVCRQRRGLGEACSPFEQASLVPACGAGLTCRDDSCQPSNISDSAVSLLTGSLCGSPDP
jgi:hypothetical protein